MYSSTYTLAAIVGAILAISAVLMWFIYAVFQIMFWSEVLDKHRAWKVPIWIAIGIFTMLPLGVVLLPLKWSLVTFIPVIVQFVCLGNLCDFAKAFGLKKKQTLCPDNHHVGDVVRLPIMRYISYTVFTKLY